MKLSFFSGGSCLLLLSPLMLAVSGCSVADRPYPEMSDTARHQHAEPPDQISFWTGDSLEGSPSVRISLSKQRAYFYKDDQLAGVSHITSGREGNATPTGKFRILEKDADHRSSRFGNYVNARGEVIEKDVDIQTDPKPPGAHFLGSPMPHYMRIADGTGMHEGYLPGYPASHGSIRMPAYMADAFSRNVAVGTPVTIER